MKKIITLLLALCLVSAMVFTGCSTTAKNTNDDDNTNVGDTKTDDGTTTAPASDEQIVITALCNAQNTMTLEPDEMLSFQRWYEETGIKIEWEFVRTDWDTRKNLVLASDDLPDTFWGNRTINLSDLTNNLDVFIPLNDYIDQSPNVSIMFSEEPDLKKMVTFPDGNIYSLPSRMPLRPDTFQGNYINQTWMDSLNLEMPTTLEEFEAVLTAFKNDDPNGNGQADEIPWSWSGTGTSFGVWWIFGSFGMANNVVDRFALIDGEPIYIPVTENYKEGIKFLNDMYTKGLIDPEVFTQDWGMWQGKCQTVDPTIMGVAGMWTTNTLMGNVNAANYSTLPPLEGTHGKPKYPSNKLTLRSAPVAWTMTTACENPDAAMRFIDHVYNPEESIQLYFGSYDVGLKKEADGTVSILGPTDPDVTYDSHVWTNAFGDMGPYYVSKAFEKTVTPNDWVLDKANIDAVYQPYIEKSSYPQMIFSEADNEELATLTTDLTNLIDQKMASWVTGEADIDAEWDAYLESMNSIGYERFMEIHKARFEVYNQ